MSLSHSEEDASGYTACRASIFVGPRTSLRYSRPELADNERK